MNKPIMPVSDAEKSEMTLLIEQQMLLIENAHKNGHSMTPAIAAHTVLAAVSEKNNNVLSNQTSDKPKATLPTPSNGPSNAPSPTFPSNQPVVVGGTGNNEGYLDKLKQFFEYMSANPTDPNGVANFMSYLVALQQNGVLDTPAVQSMLAASQFGTGEADSAIMQGVLSSLFFGYNGQNGEAGATAYLTAMKAALAPYASSGGILGQLATDVNTQIGMIPAYLTQYGFANGGTGSVSITIDGYTTTYDLNNASDVYYIQQYIANAGELSTPNSWYNPSSATGLNMNAVERAYRIAALNQLIAQYKNDPSIILCLWLMQTSDQSTLSQESGLANTTNMMTNMTNNYASPLITLVTQFGQITNPAQATQFVQDFFNASTLMNTEGQLSGLSGTWNSNVFSTVMNQTVTVNVNGANKTMPMSELLIGSMQGVYSPTEVMSGLNSLNPITPGTTGTSANAGYQAMVNAFQQAGGLITGTTQTLVTQLGTAAQNDNQYIKFGSSIVSPTGGGFVQMENQIINNQKSN